jgi:hypothetical protein
MRLWKPASRVKEGESVLHCKRAFYTLAKAVARNGGEVPDLGVDRTSPVRDTGVQATGYVYQLLTSSLNVLPLVCCEEVNMFFSGVFSGRASLVWPHHHGEKHCTAESPWLHLSPTMHSVLYSRPRAERLDVAIGPSAPRDW